MPMTTRTIPPAILSWLEEITPAAVLAADADALARWSIAFAEAAIVASATGRADLRARFDTARRLIRSLDARPVEGWAEAVARTTRASAAVDALWTAHAATGEEPAQ